MEMILINCYTRSGGFKRSSLLMLFQKSCLKICCWSKEKIHCYSNFCNCGNILCDEGFKQNCNIFDLKQLHFKITTTCWQMKSDWEQSRLCLLLRQKCWDTAMLVEVCPCPPGNFNKFSCVPASH